MKIQDTIVIQRDFTDTPGARYKTDGDFSGEEFLEKLLEPKFKKAVEGKYLLEINLENVWGFPSSFVSGSFGQLAIKFGSDNVLNHIKFVSNDNPVRIEKIISEIKNPKRK